MPADYAVFKSVVNINIYKAFQRIGVFNAKAQRRKGAENAKMNLELFLVNASV